MPLWALWGLWATWLPLALGASEAGPGVGASAEAPAAFVPVKATELPDFGLEVEERVTKSGKVFPNGLLATINYLQFKRPELGLSQTAVCLEPEVTGFRGRVSCGVYWQPRRAPLAVLLLGFYQACDDKLARVWQRYLYQAGCHVLCFDSVFRHNLNCSLGHGVAGNMDQEAKVVVKLINAFLASRSDSGGRPAAELSSGVRLLGTSYGGTLALNVLRQPEAESWPLERVLLLSPPVRFQTAAGILDRFQREDRPRYEFFLLKLLDGYTPESGQAPAAWEESLLRAGLAYEFHQDLEEAVKKNEKLYLKGLLKEFEKRDRAPQRRESLGRQKAALECELDAAREALRIQRKGGDLDAAAYERAKEDLKARRETELHRIEKTLSDPGDWDFADFVTYLTAPYWNRKPEEIWAMGDLATLLKDVPPWVQAVLAADDPLNDPAEFRALEAALGEPRLLVLPHGGHLGFAGTEWIRALVLRFFSATAAGQTSSENRASGSPSKP